MKEPNVPDSSLSPEILKFTDKLVKDPQSKLFVPLAEEYIKCGMLDEAVMVLMDGLKIHPHFLTARVTLGKAYLEKGQILEAKAQFEQVMAANRDNLFVHRKLARIYKEEGQVERAEASCQAVLSQNPKDAEMKSLLEELNRLLQKPVVRQAHHAEQSRSAEAPVTVPSALQEPSAAKEPAVAEKLHQKPVPAVSGIESAEESAPASPPAEETHPAVSVAEPEEMVTEALGDLYIKQGYYEKGIGVYQRLIAKDPSNTALQRKLEETEVLVKLLTEGPRVKTVSQPEPVPAVPEPATAAATAPLDEKERREAEKIRRLEAWLESIRKGQGR